MTSFYNRTKHGCASGRPTKEYYTWVAMKKRCLNPKNPSYPHYGGRGIKVCERWEKSFEAFLEDMGKAPTKEHSIDRIKVNGNYEPLNCRWATPSEQRNNQRPKKNEIFYNGEGTRDASRRLGGWKGMVYDRIRRGWTIEDAFSTPANYRSKNENQCA